MRKLTILLLFGITTYLLGYSNLPWGNTSYIGVAVVVNKGLAVPAWESDSDGLERGSETGPGYSEVGGANLRWCVMEPAGDGTYIVRVDLIPGADYNYIFFASAAVTLPNTGFSAGDRLGEPIPAGGGDRFNPRTDPCFFASRSSVTATAISQMLPEAPTTYCGYVRIGGDARRWIRIPGTVADGTTVYVYNNFASFPTGVNVTEIQPTENSIEIWWRGGKGFWGDGNPTMDTIGGRYFLFMSSTVTGGGQGTTFELLATLSGYTSYYHHTGLSTGATYYYIFVASDAYRGPTCFYANDGSTDTYYTAAGTPRTLSDPPTTYFVPWANLCREMPEEWGTTVDEPFNPDYPHYDRTSRPRFKIPVYFKVQDIDYNKLKPGDIVWLTPIDQDARLWPYKIPGTIYWASTKPKSGS